MIPIEELTINGFMSFGQYDTVIRMDGLKSCLITGQVLGMDDEPGDDDSNGAGKSTLANAILWCLSGKTMHSHKPGDKVIHWGAASCLVRIKFKGGDTLTRTRKGQDGHDEVLYHKDGQDISLGTNTMQDAELNRLLSFDYTMFCGSVFFAQYAKPWMEMADAARRKALEREFHLDRIQHRADYAKEKYDEYAKQQETLRVAITSAQHTITTLNSELVQLQESALTFEQDKLAHIQDLEATKGRAEAERDQVIIPDIEALKAKWSIVAKANALINQKVSAAEQLESECRSITRDINDLTATIASWNGKVGKVCSTCSRPFTAEFISSKTTTPQERLESLSAQLADKQKAAATARTNLGAIRTKLQDKQPSQTVLEAERDKKEWERRDKAVATARSNIEKARLAENKFGPSITRIQGTINQHQQLVETKLEEIKGIDRLMLHWKYVYKTYSDRRKIKGRILREYIPYLNDRVNYYLDRFQMKLRIEFTDGMGVRSNYWGYEFFCGGERKRVDVSIMLAMFDMHNLMYGPQCNVVVLDEIDGRLDKRGARLLVDIVRNDVVPKVDTVLVISHRPDMRGAFESELKIQKDSPDPDGQSRIIEVLT
jgi:DNA repair exonuclease SbcCD ATPase subunit